MSTMIYFCRRILVSSIVLVITGSLYADEKSTETAASLPAATPASQQKKEVPPHVVELVQGRLSLPVPGQWPVVKPRNRIIKHEFSVPAAKGDTVPGRMTIMSAGGSIEANIARWVGQFRTAEDKALGEKDKSIQKIKIGQLEVHLVDLKGVFQDQPRGPFGPKVASPDYRMLAAIIPAQKGGTWFVKLYGPQQTIQKASKQFQAMIKNIVIAEPKG